MKYDVAIVLGTGISQDGVLPESCLQNIKAAVKLYNDKLTSKIIFSGKWAWNCKYIPMTTEAEAMKQIAIKNGVPVSDIYTEDESYTIGSNLCNIKTQILMPFNYKNVALVCISDALVPRLELNLKMILGPEYTYEIVMAESTYTPEKYADIKYIEDGKLITAQRYFANITPGDHATIYRLGEEDVKRKLQQL